MNFTASTNRSRAAKRIQRALKKDPNDIPSLMQLAAMLDPAKQPDLDRKRNLLHRVLQLEPANREARQMLFEIDRAALGGDSSRLSAAVILPSPSSADFAEPPLILRYSVVHQFLVYFSMALTAILGLSLAHDPEVFALVVGFLVSLLVPLWFVSTVIEIHNTGLNVYRLFGLVCTEIPWSEVTECKSNALGQGVKLLTRRREVVDVSAQIYGYAFILDILRQRRPDLFPLT
ncbi:MAG TPA: hypothetical protein VFY83_11170 [Anaerolineales bacterium]|nr:hypothetical protein [Anaerolineales bacterium]